MDLTSILVAVIAFSITVLSGYFVIPFLRKLKFGQTILDIGPNWHKEKQGTPTMGGVMFIGGVLIALACGLTFAAVFKKPLMNEFESPTGLVTLIASIVMPLCMAAIGFFDDYIKVVKKRNLGLTARQKTFLQLMVSAGYLLTLAFSGMDTTYIPFLGEYDITSGLGLIFWPIALMFIYGFTNAVNLTDGIDGLASSVTLVVSCGFMMIAGILGYVGINVLTAALAGALVGFVCWNSHPAKVFMGDTGSMFLGGMVVAFSFGIGSPILLIPAGIIYLIEALSDIIQVLYYKKTKKRIFKMAPIHHHFEKCGWSEDKIVLVFSSITFVGCFIAVLPFLFTL